MIATSAFRLGVDIPDIRRIIHWGLPSTKEEYVQETGGQDVMEKMLMPFYMKGNVDGKKVRI